MRKIAVFGLVFCCSICAFLLLSKSQYSFAESAREYAIEQGFCLDFAEGHPGIKDTVVAGSVYKNDMLIENITDEPVSLTISVHPYTESDYTGRSNTEIKTSENIIVEWTKLFDANKTITIEPHSTRDFPFVVDIPKDASPGVQRAMFSFSINSPQRCTNMEYGQEMKLTIVQPTNTALILLGVFGVIIIVLVIILLIQQNNKTKMKTKRNSKRSKK